MLHKHLRFGTKSPDEDLNRNLLQRQDVRNGYEESYWSEPTILPSDEARFQALQLEPFHNDKYPIQRILPGPYTYGEEEDDFHRLFFRLLPFEKGILRVLESSMQNLPIHPAAFLPALFQRYTADPCHWLFFETKILRFLPPCGYFLIWHERGVWSRNPVPQ